MMPPPTLTPNRVTAVFTGRQRAVSIGGRSEHSAFERTDGNSVLKLSNGGILGNDLAASRRLGNDNHAVYLFSQSHYGHYENMLGRPIMLGSFAENITYVGPDETELRIGDRLQIGTAVIAVTTPRVPCYKLAHFIKADIGFPSAFSACGKTGLYARVVEEGQIVPGDSFLIIDTNQKNATLSELNEVLTDPNPSRSVLDKVLESPDMFEGLRALILERMSTLGLFGESPALTVNISEREKRTEDIISLTFDPPSSLDAVPLPGQFITLGITNSNGEQHFRCYSLTGSPSNGDDARPWRVAVKRDAGSEQPFSVSNWIHDHVRPGTSCYIYPPAGDFVLPDEISEPLLFIAGGIGITPILAQIRELARRGHAQTVSLVYVVRSLRDAAFLDELAELQSNLSEFSICLHLTRESDPGNADGVSIHQGRPDLGDAIAALGQEGHIFVCGPAAMINDTREINAKLGRANDRLNFEHFGDGGVMDSIGAADKATVHIEPGGISGVWTSGDGTLLDWIDRNTSFRPPTACRSGICRTCRATLTRGNVVYPPNVTLSKPSEVLLCCARPASDVSIALDQIQLGDVAE